MVRYHANARKGKYIGRKGVKFFDTRSLSSHARGRKGSHNQWGFFTEKQELTYKKRRQKGGRNTAQDKINYRHKRTKQEMQCKQTNLANCRLPPGAECNAPHMYRRHHCTVTYEYMWAARLPPLGDVQIHPSKVPRNGEFSFMFHR